MAWRSDGAGAQHRCCENAGMGRLLPAAFAGLGLGACSVGRRVLQGLAGEVFEAGPACRGRGGAFKHRMGGIPRELGAENEGRPTGRGRSGSRHRASQVQQGGRPKRRAHSGAHSILVCPLTSQDGGVKEGGDEAGHGCGAMGCLDVATARGPNAQLRGGRRLKQPRARVSAGAGARRMGATMKDLASCRAHEPNRAR